jgi:hypothetical protein
MHINIHTENVETTTEKENSTTAGIAVKKAKQK